MADELEVPLRCSWLSGARRAHGYLVVEEDLSFICLYDDSETAGAAGKAAAGQFGLIGALVGAGVGAAREGLRGKKLKELYQAQQGMTTGQRLAQHPMSMQVKRAQVTALQKGPHIVPTLETANGPVAVQADGPGVHEAIEAWATAGNALPVKLVEPKKMSRTAKLSLIFTIPALVGLYLLVCLPFAVRHLGVESKAISGFAEFKERAKAAQQQLQGLTQSFGKPLADSCGEMLAKIPVEQQMALVGPLPASSPIKVEKDYYGFPRYTRIEAPYSKYGEGRLEDDQLESKWRREASFGDSYLAMLGSPFDWVDRSGRVWGLPQMENVTTVLVGKIERLEAANVGGRALLAVRVLDYPGMSVKCEGDLEVTFGSTSSGSVGNDFLMAQGLPRAMHLLSCKGNSRGPCHDVNYYAALAPPAPPAPPAVEPAAAPVAKAPAAKAGAKRTTKKKRR